MSQQMCFTIMFNVLKRRWPPSHTPVPQLSEQLLCTCVGLQACAPQ